MHIALTAIKPRVDKTMSVWVTLRKRSVLFAFESVFIQFKNLSILIFLSLNSGEHNSVRDAGNRQHLLRGGG